MNQGHRTQLTIALTVGLLGWGCSHRGAPPARKQTVATPPAAPAGRLVPAVVAGFEHGEGAWQCSVRPRSTVAKRIENTGASRGTHWLSVRIKGRSEGPHTLDTFVDLPRVDWSRFGDTLRIDVIAKAKSAGVTAQLYVVGKDGVEALGNAEPVRPVWHTVVWQPNAGLEDVKRIGVRWLIPETYQARVGLDNVRVGAAAALNDAWSVAAGPFKTRDEAVTRMSSLQDHKVPSFPVYVEGWYLNVGTFSSETVAKTESKRLKGMGVATTIIQR